MNGYKTIATALLFAGLTTSLIAATAHASHESATHPSSSHHAKAVESDSAMAAEAKISMAAAKATALAKVPGGTIKSSELEREHGKLIYSFDISVPGKSGIQEVNVDAISGKVISSSHEGTKSEQKEQKQEQSEVKSDSTKKSHGSL